MSVNLGKQAMLYTVLVALVGCGTPAATSNVASNAAIDVADEAPPADLPVLNPRWQNNCFGSFEHADFHYPAGMTKGAIPIEAFFAEWSHHPDRFRTKDEETFKRTVIEITKLSEELSKVAYDDGDSSEIFKKIRAMRSEMLKYYDYKKIGETYFSTLFLLYEKLFMQSALYEFMRTGKRVYIDIAYDENVIGKNLIQKIDNSIKSEKEFFDRDWIVSSANDIAFFALKAALDNNLTVANYLNKKVEDYYTRGHKHSSARKSKQWSLYDCDKKQQDLYTYKKMALVYEAYRFHPDEKKKEIIENYINVLPSKSYLSDNIRKIQSSIEAR